MTYLNTTEAGLQLGVHRDTVRSLIKREELAGFRVARPIKNTMPSQRWDVAWHWPTWLGAPPGFIHRAPGSSVIRQVGAHQILVTRVILSDQRILRGIDEVVVESTAHIHGRLMILEDASMGV